jgi:hypothetical protein
MTYVCTTPRAGVVDISSVAAAASLGQPGTSVLPSVVMEPQFGEIATGWDPSLGGGEFLYARCATTVVASQTISSITVAAGVATLTTGSAHGLVPGQAIQIIGAAPSGYVGVFTVLTTPSTTTLTFATTSTVSATTVGTYVVGIGQGMVCELAYTLTAGVLVITATPWAGTAVSGKPLAISVNNIFSAQASWFQVQGAAITVVNGTITVGNPLYWQAAGTVSNAIVVSKQVLGAAAASLISAVINSGQNAVTLQAFQALVFIDRIMAQGAIT